jgi:DNA processing protein
LATSRPADDLKSHWGFALAQELGRVDPAHVLEQAAALDLSC